jgi:hypothetical protein
MKKSLKHVFAISSSVVVLLVLLTTAAMANRLTVWENTCYYIHDRESDDGGPNSLYHLFAYGTDCGDCGPRRVDISPITIQNQYNLWPYTSNSGWYRGDAEFSGAGPEVTASARLSLKNDNNSEVWVHIWLDAQETEWDWRSTGGDWDFFVGSVPFSREIVGIISPAKSITHYMDTNHNLDRLPAAGNLVSQFEIMGDTGGDIGGNDVNEYSDDDVYINIIFNNPALVTLVPIYVYMS